MPPYLRSIRGRLVATTVVGALVLFSLAGCGGGSSSAEGHPDVASAADASCRAAVESAEAIPPPEGSYRSLTSYAAQLAPVVEKLAAELEELSPEKGQEAALDEYIGALKGGLAGLRTLSKAEDGKTVKRAAARISTEPVAAAARKLGAPECAKPPA